MQLLAELTLIFSIAALILYISARLKAPTIIGLIFSGLVVGPYGLGLIQSESDIQVLAEIGILLLLFTIGVEFSMEKLSRTLRWIILGGGAQVFLTAGVVTLGGVWLGLPGSQAIFIGCLFSVSSTAIVLHLFRDKGQLDTPAGRAGLAVLIFQDIIIIPMMLAAPYLAGGPEAAQGVGWKLLKGAAIITMILALARYLLPPLLRSIVHTRNQELFLVSILVICFATAFITQLLGLKLALGAFLAGLIVSESEYSYSAISKILPLKKIFVSLFFISIGMMLQLPFFLDNWALLIGLTALVMLTKLLLLSGIALGLKLGLANALILGLSLSQVGEFAFVLSRAGNEYGLLTDDQYQIFLGVSILSMALSTYLITIAPALAQRIASFPLFSSLACRFGNGAEPVTDAEPSGHLVIIGYGVCGRQIAYEAKQQKATFHIIELDEALVGAARQQGEKAHAGDARDKEVLLRAGTDKAAVIAIAISDAAAAEDVIVKARKLNPNAHIIIRTLFISEIDIMEQLGADEIIPAQWEASMQISKRAMAAFNREHRKKPLPV
ncbi:MAG: cation:proton antiporter [Phaeodactylibacter sp.]|nr:cation:proton antiporter [Phaeodactylibacter sp.]